MSFSTLNPNDARNLERPFKEEEVFTALNDMEEDKAPSLTTLLLPSGKTPRSLSKQRLWSFSMTSLCLIPSLGVSIPLSWS